MPLTRLLPLLAALLALTAAALAAQLSVSAWRSDARSTAGLRFVSELSLALAATEMVSRERGPANGLLGEAVPLKPERVQALAAARARTDDAWAALGQALQDVRPETVRDDAMRRLDAARAALVAARAAVDRAGALPLERRPPEAIRGAVHDMVVIVPMLAPVIGRLADEAQKVYPALGDDVQGARLTAELREYAGLLGSHFTAALARRQPFTREERLAIERTRGRIDELRFLVELHVGAANQPEDVTRAWRVVRQRYFDVAGRLVDRVIATGEADGVYDVDAADFAAAYVPHMNVMFDLRDALLHQAAVRARVEHGRAARVLALASALSLLMLIVLVGTIVLVHRRVLRPLAATTRALNALACNDLLAPLPEPVARDEIAAVIGAVRTLQAQTRQREVLEQERDGLIQRLHEQSNSDFLTGLPNRRAFFAAAQRELALARRHEYEVVAILFDIDNFKSFNDRLGHAAGDRALADVAKVVRCELRGGDLVGRYGGEEFVLLLAYCDSVNGLLFADRLCAAIEAAPVVCPDGTVARVTASLGVADSRRYGLNLETLLSRADAAMYRAKAGGRNRVALAEEIAHDAEADHAAADTEDAGLDDTPSKPVD